MLIITIDRGSSPSALRRVSDISPAQSLCKYYHESTVWYVPCMPYYRYCSISAPAMHVQPLQHKLRRIPQATTVRPWGGTLPQYSRLDAVYAYYLGRSARQLVVGEGGGKREEHHHPYGVRPAGSSETPMALSLYLVMHQCYSMYPGHGT